MSDITEQQAAAQQAAPVDKGKGKAVEPIETEDESSDDEMQEVEGADEPEEDDLAEIDMSNIINTGRRTRGKQIDFAKAAAEEPAKDDEDDEEDDDFEAPEDEHHDADAMDTK